MTRQFARRFAPRANYLDLQRGSLIGSIRRFALLRGSFNAPSAHRIGKDRRLRRLSNALFFNKNEHLQIFGLLFRNQNAKCGAPLSKCLYSNVSVLLQNVCSRHSHALKTLFYKHSVGSPIRAPHQMLIYKRKMNKNNF